MSKRLTTLALVSAAVLGMATAASAQTQNSGGRANDPELNNNTTAPSGSGGAMQQRQNRNMGTTGQGNGAPSASEPGNDTPPAAGAGRVNKKDQQ